MDDAVRRLAENPDHLGICIIGGSAHGYEFTGELVQRKDGTLLRRVWNDLGAAPALAPVDIEIDLEREWTALNAIIPPGSAEEPFAALERLKKGQLEGVTKVLDRAVPWDAGKGRFATLELVVGSRRLRIMFRRPLLGDPFVDMPVSRLYRAIWEWPK
jgi:hypothetical protein